MLSGFVVVVFLVQESVVWTQRNLTAVWGEASRTFNCPLDISLHYIYILKLLIFKTVGLLLQMSTVVSSDDFEVVENAVWKCRVKVREPNTDPCGAPVLSPMLRHLWSLRSYVLVQGGVLFPAGISTWLRFNLLLFIKNKSSVKSYFKKSSSFNSSETH